MSTPAENQSERGISAEYLKEYGGLIIDVSTFIEALDSSTDYQDDEQTFDVELIDEAIDAPQQVYDAIGPVKSASVTYGQQENSPIIVELYGQSSSYRISRYPDVAEHIDTVIAIPPLDSISHALLAQRGGERKHDLQPDTAFEDHLKDIPGLSNADFVHLLLTLAHPGVKLPGTKDDNAVLESTDAFSPIVKDALRDATHLSASLHNGFIEYNFLADDTAALAYSYENGRASYFQFICESEDGEKLQFRGTVNKSVDLDFPRRATATGIDQDIIDTTHSFPMTLKEMRYIRSILTQETASLPQNPIQALSLPDDIEIIAENPIEENVIDKIIDDQREEEMLEYKARQGWMDDQILEILTGDEKGEKES